MTAAAILAAPRLETRRVDLARGERAVLHDLTVSVPSGSFTAIVGPNGCGKSTLLLALSRVLAPSKGEVLIDGAAVASLGAKAFARQVGLMPQSSIAPDGIVVAELVACGRFPHQSALRQWSAADEAAVRSALELTGLSSEARRPVNELSGGQRQRAWIALVLAQETPVLFLDEPTTFLDISHQMEVMGLLERLNRESGRTIAAVLHDLNQACRFATHMIAMREGRIAAEGTPEEVVTRRMLAEVYGLDALIIPDPLSGTPLVIPRGGHRDATSPKEPR